VIRIVDIDARVKFEDSKGICDSDRSARPSDRNVYGSRMAAQPAGCRLARKHSALIEFKPVAQMHSDKDRVALCLAYGVNAPSERRAPDSDVA
jgi:hypothetical protein